MDMTTRAATMLLGLTLACSPRPPAKPVTWHVECSLTCDGSPSTVSLDLCKPDDLSHADVLEGTEVTAQIVFAIAGCSKHTSDCRATPGTVSCSASPARHEP